MLVLSILQNSCLYYSNIFFLLKFLNLFLFIQLQTRLIDSEDIIDSAGFYNYLTAWFHLDNMMCVFLI